MPPTRSEVRSSWWGRRGWGKAALLFGALVSVWTPAPPAAANGWEHGSIPLPLLIRGLKAEDVSTRQRSAEYLGRRGDRTALAPLLAMLAAGEREPSVRSAAYLALGQLRDRQAIPTLTTCLEREREEGPRSDCVTALGDLAAGGTLPFVLGALAEDGSPLVRSRAVDALGGFSEPEAVAALTAVLRDRQAISLRQRAIRALGRTRAEGALDPLLDALGESRSDEERLAIVTSFAHLRRSEAVPALTRLLEQTGNAALRVGTVAALATIREGSAYATLTALLDDPVPAVRYFAVEGLGGLGDRRAAGPLTDLSLALSERVARRTPAELMATVDTTTIELKLETTALRALSDIDPVVGLPALLSGSRPLSVDRSSVEALEIADAAYERRRVALYGLGYTRSREAAEVLSGENGLGDGDPRLRAAAARSLAVLGFEDASDLLIARLSDRSAEVRATVARVLGVLGDRRAVGPLVGRLADENSDVRREAARALGFIGDDVARDALERLLAAETTESVRATVRDAIALLSG